MGAHKSDQRALIEITKPRKCLDQDSNPHHQTLNSGVLSLDLSLPS